MGKLAAAEAQSEWDETGAHRGAAPEAEADAMTSRMFVRARLMMIISGLTTLLAIAAVIGVIGYRAFRAGGSGAAPTAEGIITLPKGARVIASTIADERIVVTLDIAGAIEIRTFDVKTLKQTGRIRFATEP
jgi:ATP-dependent protease HslVU (ClpYQ) peptidase subunit